MHQQAKKKESESRYPVQVSLSLYIFNIHAHKCACSPLLCVCVCVFVRSLPPKKEALERNGNGSGATGSVVVAHASGRAKSAKLLRNSHKRKSETDQRGGSDPSRSPFFRLPPPSLCTMTPRSGERGVLRCTLSIVVVALALGSHQRKEASV